MYQNPTTSPAARTHGASQLPASVSGPRLIVVLSTALLVILGLVMVFSASSIANYVDGGDAFADMRHQLEFAAAGLFFCVLVARFVPYRFWMGPATWVAFIGSVLLLVMTALIGTSELGAQRWLNIGPVSFQPSELAKVGILLMVAKLVYDFQEGSISQGWFLAYFGGINLLIVVLVLAAQSDLGTTLICVAGITAIIWLAELPLLWVGGYVGLVSALGVLSLFVGYRWQRIMSFLNPWDDYYGSGYQLIHSFYAFAQGGIFGQGLGHSAEKYLYLPEAHTDFIFAIIGEELGMVGALLVIFLFLAFLLGGLRMAQSAPERFGAVLCGSFATIIVFQAFLNMGCAMGVLPVTGKPLPFISAGGTSLIISLIMVGFMLSVSHGSDEPPQYRQRRQNLRVMPGGYDDYGDYSYGRPSRGSRPSGGPGGSRIAFAPKTVSRERWSPWGAAGGYSRGERWA